MRRIDALATILCLGLLAPVPLSGQEAEPTPPPDGTPFVFVNSQELLERAPGAAEAQRTWESQLQEYRREIQDLAGELDSLQRAYQRQESMLSEQARRQRQQEIVEKQREFRSRQMELEERAGQRQQELLRPILEEVREVLQDVREERGYRMVFDVAAAGVLSADPSLDITDLVLARMRARAGEGGGEGGAPGDAGG